MSREPYPSHGKGYFNVVRNRAGEISIVARWTSQEEADERADVLKAVFPADQYAVVELVYRRHAA